MPNYRGAQRLGPGSPGRNRAGQTGGLVTQDAHARFQEAVLQGNVWIGSNASGTPVTTQAGVSATTPALVLYNPINSPVNLVLWEFGCVFTAAPAAAAAVMLAYNMPSKTGAPLAPITTTLASITNAMIGWNTQAVNLSNGGWGQCYAISTLSAAPVAFRYCFGTTGAAAISGMTGIDHIDGAVIVPPGVAISVQASSAAAVLCHFMWEELLIIPG